MSVGFHHWLRVVILTLMGLGLATLMAWPARAGGPWHVAPGGNDGNDCLSAATPCASIKGALDKAGFAPGDTVLVASGTYTGTSDEVVLLNQSATLSGGWDGAFTGQSGFAVLDGENARRGVAVIGGDISATIERFIVQNGFAPAGGGGIFFSPTSGDLTVNDSTIHANSGGGIFFSTTFGLGGLTVNDSLISDNSGHGLDNGGAVDSFVVNNSIIRGNTGDGLSGYGGSLNNSTVRDNGGHGISGFFMSLNHSTVTGNAGDGIHGVEISLNHSSVSGNQGRGIFNDSGSLTLDHSAVTGNANGGIDNVNGAVVLNNSTLSGNQTDGSGGGILSSGSFATVSLNSVTVSNNSAALAGGGIFNDLGAGSVTLKNTLLAGNTAGAGLDCSGALSSAGYNLIEETAGCSFSPTTGDLTEVAANLDPLTGSPGYHPLRPDSPAVNAGNPGGCRDNGGQVLSTDQRGLPRFGRCDIGAYELQPLAYSTKTVAALTALPTQPLTYTLVLSNGGAAAIAGAQVTDTLPGGLTYVDGSLSASSGAGFGHQGGVITWTGAVEAGAAVIIHYAAAADQSVTPGLALVNVAVISGGGELITRTAVITVSPFARYFPLILRQWSPSAVLIQEQPKNTR